MDALEREIGARLPTAYRSFLLDSDGGVPQSNVFSIPGGDGSSGVNEFMSVADIRALRAEDPRRFPGHLVPVAHAEGGNLVFLDVRDGSVHFWDHELEDVGPWRRLDDDFGRFWDGLEKFDPSSVELDPADVQSVWVNPDLLKQYGVDK